jgi:hypothetical protein
MKKITSYTLLTVSLIIFSLVGIMAFLPSPSAAEVPITSSNYEEDSTFIPTPQRADNTEIWKIARYVSKKEKTGNNYVIFITFKDELDTIPDTFFKDNAQAFGLRNQYDEMRLTRKNGNKGHGFEQYYKGIYVRGAGYGIYSYDPKNVPYEASGCIVENLDIDVVPKLSEAEALTIVTDSIGAKRYAWEVEELNEKAKKYGDTFYPKGELVIYVGHTGIPRLAKNASLTYKFLIFDEEEYGYEAYIDAHTGKILYLYSTMTCQKPNYTRH